MRWRQIQSSLNRLAIPRLSCLKNRYWDPLVLNALFMDSKNIPLLPEGAFENGLADKLCALLKYLRTSEYYATLFSKRIPNSYHSGQRLHIFCSHAEKWARETPLAIILSTAYHSNPDHIDDTVALLQNAISFDLPFLLRPLYDILEKDGIFLTFLEMGAFKPISRKLIEIGIPRETAINLANIVFPSMPLDNKVTYEYIRCNIKRSYANLSFWQQIQVSFIL